jgi:hypothetical protein
MKYTEIIAVCSEIHTKHINVLWEEFLFWMLQLVLHNVSLKRSIHAQWNWAILLCDVIDEGKNWVNCAVLTGNSAGLRTVLSSRLSHT